MRGMEVAYVDEAVEPLENANADLEPESSGLCAKLDGDPR